MRSWKRWIGIPILVLAAAYPIAWLVARNSDAYAEAERFLRSSSILGEQIGTVTDTSIEPFAYSLRWTGARGDAHFKLDLKGSKAEASAYVELAKRGAAWEVHLARVTVPGRPVMELPTK